MNDRKATLKALQDELAAAPARADRPAAEHRSSPSSATSGSRRSRSALQSRVAWDRILREISSILPEDVWLTNSLRAVAAGGHGAPAPAPAP